jgi:hypothetical protein
MKGPGFIIFLLLASINLPGQNLLNSKSEEILKYVDKNYPEMVLEKDFKNEHYTYLKFTDDNETVTMLFFLSDESRCTSIRFIYDPDMKKTIIADLNNKYRYVGENLWYDGKSKNRASIELKTEDWFITVSITPIKTE